MAAEEVCILGSFANDIVDLVFISILLTMWMSSCCQAGDAQLSGCQQHSSLSDNEMWK